MHQRMIARDIKLKQYLMNLFKSNYCLLSLLIILSYMKINHQKIKHTSITSSIIKNLQSQSRLMCAPIRCNCHCETKISLINEQILKINSRIALILKLIQISPQNCEQTHNKSEIETKNQSQFVKAEQKKQKSEESFLLDGIQSQISRSAIIEYPQYRKINHNSFYVGKEIGRLTAKVKEYEESTEQFGRIKNNLSLLTKIVEHMEARFQNSQKLMRKLNNIIVFREKLSSNCSVQLAGNNQAELKVKKLRQKINNWGFSPIPESKSMSMNVEEDKIQAKRKKDHRQEKDKLQNDN